MRKLNIIMLFIYFAVFPNVYTSIHTYDYKKTVQYSSTKGPGAFKIIAVQCWYDSSIESQHVKQSEFLSGFEWFEL